MVDIVVTRCNPIVYDSRVFKIVRSLSKRYSLLAIGWNREKVAKNIVDGYTVDLKLCGLPAPFGKSLTRSPKMVIYYAYYWIWVFIQLTRHRPKVVHACDLDTVIPCFFYKLLFRKKLIFDVFDRYAMAFVPSHHKLFYSAVNHLEEFYSSHADVLITISEQVLRTFRRRPKRCVVIMNCPEDHAMDKRNSSEANILRIVYTGDIVSKTRGLENITAVVKDLDNVELIIAGWYMESDRQFLDEILKIPNVKFMGLLEPNDALALEASSDVMIGLYVPELQWHHVTLPNKLFEAMMCGVPLITNVATELVNAIGFGIMVQYNDVKQIKDAIIALRDNADLRRRLGSNGRKAFLENYNWTKMEEEIFKVYSSLMQK